MFIQLSVLPVMQLVPMQSSDLFRLLISFQGAGRGGAEQGRVCEFHLSLSDGHHAIRAEGRGNSVRRQERREYAGRGKSTNKLNLVH